MKLENEAVRSPEIKVDVSESLRNLWLEDEEKEKKAGSTPECSALCVRPKD